MATILGIDHVCVSCKNIQNDFKLIHELGYETLFTESNLEISDEKRIFLSQNHVNHDLVFLNSPQNVSIELIDHYGVSGNYNDVFSLVFDVPKKITLNFKLMDRDFICELLENELNSKISKKKIPEIQLTFYQKETDTTYGLSMLIIKNKCIDKASNFWCQGFGFRSIKSSIFNNLRYEILQFSAPIKQWSFKLLLIEEKSKKNIPNLDDLGCTCLSFVVNDIKNFLEKLNNFGMMSIGKPYDVKIGGKEMRLVFLRGPEHEIVELIEFKKKNEY